MRKAHIPNEINRVARLLTKGRRYQDFSRSYKYLKENPDIFYTYWDLLVMSRVKPVWRPTNKPGAEKVCATPEHVDALNMFDAADMR